MLLHGIIFLLWYIVYCYCYVKHLFTIHAKQKVSDTLVGAQFDVSTPRLFMPFYGISYLLWCTVYCSCACPMFDRSTWPSNKYYNWHCLYDKVDFVEKGEVPLTVRTKMLKTVWTLILLVLYLKRRLSLDKEEKYFVRFLNLLNSLVLKNVIVETSNSKERSLVKCPRVREYDKEKKFTCSPI